MVTCQLDPEVNSVFFAGKAVQSNRLSPGSSNLDSFLTLEIFATIVLVFASGHLRKEGGSE
jgi:hypothetical protein